MTYEFAKYPDGTIGVFSNIGKKDNGDQYITVTFERPTNNGFDTFVVELPSYNIILEDGNYTDDEKKIFLDIIKNGSSFFFKYARLGGLKIA